MIQINKSLEEESTTLKSEEQIKSSTTPLSSVSNSQNHNNINNSINNRSSINSNNASSKRSPRTQQSSLSLATTEATAGSERGLAKGIKGVFFKFSVQFSIFLTKLKFIADEVLSSDEIENQIFYPTDSSSVLSELYEDNDEDLIPSYDMTTDNKFEYPINDIRNINIEAKAEAMRAQLNGEPFIEGDKLWGLQNQQWLIPSDEFRSMNGQLKLQKKIAEQELGHLVSTKDYSIVYNHLILKNKSLKKPMNLKDLLKVINAGWTVHKTWERAAQGI